MNIEKIFTTSDVKLKKELRNELIKMGYDKSVVHNKAKYLYAEGNAPYMLVAHLDTVHTNLPSVICYSKDGDVMMSPNGIGGDDRCGVYIILSLLKRLPYMPHVVFTMDEEIGGIGADAFIKDTSYIDLKYIVEFDRKGNNDCVFYHCDNREFVDFVEQFGFKEAYGTFSDISTIAPYLGVAAVNLSSGYYNPHTQHEYVSLKDMEEIINKAEKMLCTECQTFEYIEKEYQYTSYQSKWEYSKTVSVSFVPAGMLWLNNTKTCDMRLNKTGEIAIDIEGNYYKYDAYYGDLYVLNEVYIDDVVPTYNADLATTLPIFSF